MIQTLHMKCAIFLVILCTMTCVRSWPDIMENDVSADSDDETKLKQALILVDLLKNEYVRALRENRELRKMDNKPTMITEPESTCASSDEPNTTAGTVKNPPTPKATLATRITSRATTASPITANPKQRKITQNLNFPLNKKPTFKPGRRRRPVGKTSKSFKKSPGQNRGFQPHSKFNRRRMPDPIDYSTRKPSKKTIKPGKKTIKPGKKTIKPVSFRRHNTERQMLRADEPSIQIELETVEEEDNPPINNQPSPAAPGTVYTEDTTTTEDTTATLDTPIETEPVEAQVASELLSEMTTEKPKQEFSLKYLTLIKPTLKVHLSGSSRLPIPLPENHAFCYTNPKNPLCRTSV